MEWIETRRALESRLYQVREMQTWLIALVVMVVGAALGAAVAMALFVGALVPAEVVRSALWCHRHAEFCLEPTTPTSGGGTPVPAGSKDSPRK